MTWRSKVSRVKVKGHVGQDQMSHGQGQMSHGSESKVIRQGQIRILIAFVSYISLSDTGRWAHISVKLLYCKMPCYWGKVWFEKLDLQSIVTN